MMVRTQVALSSEDHRRAKDRAARMGISLAEYVRRVIARDLGASGAPSDASRLFDLGDSGGSDVARHKDEYLAAAVRRGP